MVSNYNNAQFAELSENLTGVTLVYKTVMKKTGEIRYSATNFSGKDYTPLNSTQDEIFRVWKNVVSTFWFVKAEEAGLRVDNSGISSKLRSGVPCEIIVRTLNKESSKRWDVENSVWKRIGLVPTKKDLEECARNFKKKIHKATVASFNALKFRVNFEEEEIAKNEKMTKE